MAAIWTAEQAAALAPDASALKAARGLVVPRSWRALGQAEAVVWGECQGSAAQPYRVQVATTEPAFKCACPSRKQPCKHVLGLLLLLAEQPALFEAVPPPDWVSEWLAARARRAEQRSEKVAPAAPVAPSAQTATLDRRAVEREARVAAGLAEFEQWLTDLVRRGLASLPAEGYGVWERPAARLVDAQAAGVARRLRAVSGLPATGEGWPERLLERLGGLYLLVEAYRRLASLPPAVQADVRTLIGWTVREEEVLAGPARRDRWLVLGQRVEVEDRLRSQRTWLWGEASGQAAQILQFAHGNQPFGTTLPPPGSVMDADLAFYPSAYPQRAVVVAQHGPSCRMAGLPGYVSIAEATAAYAAALACRPWLAEFPLALSTVVPVCEDGRWLVRDLAGDLLPLAPRFDDAWALLALSGGRPLALFGEWDGEALFPLSVWAEEQFTWLTN